MKSTLIRFRIRNRGGAFGGQTFEHKVPEFDWALFKNTPNAEAFTRKAYFAAAQKIVRDLIEEKATTEEHHLNSMEALVARSLKFTRQEIQEWCESRDWAKAQFTTDPEKAINTLKSNLPGLSSDEFAFPVKLRTRAAEIVAEVADSKSDPIADYLFVKLAQERPAFDF